MYFKELTAALLLTWLTEGAVTFFMTKSPKYLLFNIWCSTLTNPLLNIALFALNVFGRRTVIACAAAGEIAVLIAEAKLYKFFDKMSGDTIKNDSFYFKLSFITNAVSLAVGTAVFGI